MGASGSPSRGSGPARTVNRRGDFPTPESSDTISLKSYTVKHRPSDYNMSFADFSGCSLMENLDDRAIEQVADFFGAFAVPMRLKILNALRHGERNVGDLTAEFGCSQANVSKHLSVLAQKGLIAKTLRGTSAFYRIVDPRIFQLCDLVCTQVGQRFAQHAAMKDMFVDASRAARAPARKGAGRGR